VEPRKIAALTFTRKSAGEFLSAVFDRLAEAALNPEKLADLQTKEYLQNLDATQCRAMLGKLALQLGCLGMGTIDSLFARIARAFPLESGLAEDFAMAGEAEIQAARERTLAALFATESTASLADFIDLLRRINRTHGERNVFENLLRETKNLHGKFLATPEDATWGDAAAIWETGCNILNAGAVSSAADAFIQAVLETHEDFSDEAENILRANLDSLRSLDFGGSWNQEISNIVKSRLGSEPTSGNLRITPKKEGWLNLNARVRAARLDFLYAALKPEFESLLQRSRSLHALMKKFEEAYSALVRSAGLVNFGDITDSLARRATDVDWNTTAGYRIDQTFEHWLLDEFQDTSRPQWKILKTFIDEVVMDSEQQRSFFYVGDTKQAIYSWRGGDPDLFFEIFEKFNKHSPIIQDAPPLTESWRSCQSILDFVNQVFGDLMPIKDILEIPDAAAEKWVKAWSNHITSPKTREINGYAEWISVPKNDGDDDEHGDAQDQKVLEILETTQAWKRGLSCAVLKRDNNGVAALAALLQSKGIPVAVEGKTNPCIDNPLGAALLAALRVVASPDDKLSHAVAQGFPSLSAWGVGDWKFRKQTLARLAQSGFAATIRQWIESFGLEAEPFLKERAAAFLLAAEEFDACRKSSDGITDFIRFVENRQTQENEATDVVRIMTIHQSKGLGFDMVIASGLDKKGGGNDGTKLALGPSASEVKWGVLLPAKDFAEQDDVLRKQIKIDEADKKYGEICTAYVALTRAKKALYVVTTELGENTKSKNFARHLGLQFGSSLVQFGNAKWFEADKTKDADSISAPAAPIVFHAPFHGTPKPVSPSSFKAESAVGLGIAGLSLDAAELGTEVHEALAGIEWLESSALQMDALSREAADLVRGFLQKPIAQTVFTKPPNPADLWRERAFDFMLEGQWVSGVFDRVVLHRSNEGSPTAAIIYDFKTDHGTAAEIEERYAGQMEVYRKAVCRLLRLSPECVKSQILCVR
jgi:ATP-dependent exoDNAse (exonuclease V) beta subunit